MLRIFYTVFLYLTQPAVFLFILLKSIKLPIYRQRLNERYGYYKNIKSPKPNGILIHAASVGEVIAATPLINALQKRYPHYALTMTTVTPTGSERVKAIFGKDVTHVYLPYDIPSAIKRFIRFVKPRICIVIETEIWPNLIHQLQQIHIPFIIANARLSSRSAKRYGWFKKGLTPMFDGITLIAPQDSISQQRYLELGYDPKKLKIMGNLKFDVEISATLLEQISQFRQKLAGRLVWIAASTHEGEEEIIIDAHTQLIKQFNHLLLIIVPRHPQRFDSTAELIKRNQFNFTRLSQRQPISNETQVILGDTLGELMLLYGISDVSFVGGSLTKIGGHNPLEPLAFKLPVISGKNTHNFPEIYKKLRDAQGVIEIESNANSLIENVKSLLSSQSLRQSYGEKGYQVLTENSGASARFLNLLSPYLDEMVSETK